MILPTGCLIEDWKSLPTLGEGEVQVFAIRTDADPGLVTRAERLLSPAELVRAARVRVPHARDEFMVGRAALRVLLGSALQTEPKSLAIQVDAFGKPFVPGVYSNVSHSRGLIYLALCRAAAIGIDVEWIDPDLEVLEIAQANFTAEDVLYLRSKTTGMERVRTFCQIWTRKEAVAKAHGQGLRTSLRNIRVPQGEAGQAVLSTSPRGSSVVDFDFFLQELPTPAGFAAALAIAGRAAPVRLFFDRWWTDVGRVS